MIPSHVPLDLWPGYLAGWQTAMDDLFGPYRWRYVSVGGTCFECGGRILKTETSKEKERGGTTWLVHLDCPGKVRRKK